MMRKLFDGVANRRTLSPVLLACILFGTAGFGAEPPTIRVLTYNIQHGQGTDGQIDLQRTADVIKRIAPDVAALQEVDRKTTRSRGVDQAAELAKLTGMHSAFGKAMDFGGGAYGEALLSRYPLETVTVHDLPYTDGCEPRCVIAARVKIGEAGPEILFAGTHLEHAKAVQRLCQSSKISPALAVNDSGPAILAGDFNDIPDSPVMMILKRHWADATAEQPDPTWPSEKPRSKIDYVLFRPTGVWQIVERQVINEPVASDHRPLLVVLRWTDAGAPGKD
jgi:endonuclease/exonuclease/phosphatase family metal-dependent hydrolase